MPEKPGLSQTYTDYLASVEWQAKRQELLALRGRRCESCGSPVDITVHHLTYERLGHESMSDLEVLCWTCHAELEGRKQKRIAPPIEAVPVRRAKPAMNKGQLERRRAEYMASKRRDALRELDLRRQVENDKHTKRLAKDRERLDRERSGDARLRQLKRLITPKSHR